MDNKPVLEGTEFQAIGVVKIPTTDIGNYSYSVLTLSIKDGVVTQVEMSPPTLKEATIEQAKIKFVKTFVLEKQEIKKMEDEFYTEAVKIDQQREAEAQAKRDKRAKQKAEQ